MERSRLGNGPRTVIEEFQRLKSTDVVLPTSTGRDIRIRCITTTDEAQRILFDRLGLQLPARLGEPKWHVGDHYCPVKETFQGYNPLISRRLLAQ